MPYSYSRHSPEEVDNERSILARLTSEEQKAATGEEDGSQEDDYQNKELGNEHELEKYNEEDQVRLRATIITE